MVRVAGLKAQVTLGVKSPSQDGLTPAQQLAAISSRVTELMHDQHACWRELRQELAGVGIKVLDVSDLSAQDREWLRQRFQDDIFPILTPLAIDPAHPFPFIPNLDRKRTRLNSSH